MNTNQLDQLLSDGNIRVAYAEYGEPVMYPSLVTADDVQRTVNRDHPQYRCALTNRCQTIRDLLESGF